MVSCISVIPNGDNIAPCGRFSLKEGRKFGTYLKGGGGDEVLSGAMLFWTLLITTSSPNCYLEGNNQMMTFGTLSNCKQIYKSRILSISQAISIVIQIVIS